jgi:hypothetical protein
MRAAGAAIQICLKDFVLGSKGEVAQALHGGPKEGYHSGLHGVCDMQCTAVITDHQFALGDRSRTFQEIGFTCQIDGIGAALLDNIALGFVLLTPDQEDAIALLR